MNGDFLPYMYIDTTVFPYSLLLRHYPNGFGWYFRHSSDNANITFPTVWNNANSGIQFAMSINSKVSSFNLTSEISTTASPSTDPLVSKNQILGRRKTAMNLIYPDDVDIVSVYSVGNNLTADNIDNLMFLSASSGAQYGIDTQYQYAFGYIGKRFTNSWQPCRLQCNPHTFATAESVPDYDYALVKYGRLSDGMYLQCVYDHGVMPLGWVDTTLEYSILLPKSLNAFLSGTYQSRYWPGFGVREITYLKTIV